MIAFVQFELACAWQLTLKGGLTSGCDPSRRTHMPCGLHVPGRSCVLVAASLLLGVSVVLPALAVDTSCC